MINLYRKKKLIPLVLLLFSTFLAFIQIPSVSALPERVNLKITFDKIKIADNYRNRELSDMVLFICSGQETIDGEFKGVGDMIEKNVESGKTYSINKVIYNSVAINTSKICIDFSISFYGRIFPILYGHEEFPYIRSLENLPSFIHSELESGNSYSFRAAFQSKVRNVYYFIITLSP